MTGSARRFAPEVAATGEDPPALRVARPLVPPAVFVIALAAGCATSGEPPVPPEVRDLAIAPYAIHEACHRLAAGDRLDWRYASRMPIHFNIHYHDGPSVVMPVSRDASFGDSGIFVATIAHDYCAMWEAGPPGSVIDYAVRPIRAAR